MGVPEPCWAYLMVGLFWGFVFTSVIWVLAMVFMIIATKIKNNKPPLKKQG